MNDEDDYIDIDDDVRCAVDGLAADMFRGDYQHARERIQRLKADWRRAGGDARSRALRDEADEEALRRRAAPVYLSTLDSLLVPYSIDRLFGNAPYPYDLVIPTRKPPADLSMDYTAEFSPIPVRRYRWMGRRHNDGKPIYDEVSP